MRWSAVPRPLRPLLACVAVFGVAWALVTPPWQAPDEALHYAYSESLGARLALPGGDRPLLSSDQSAAEVAVGAGRIEGSAVEAHPAWTSAPREAYDAGPAPSRVDGGGTSGASVNPPLYYLVSDLGYWAAWTGDAYDRLYAMRLVGVLLLLASAVGAWLLAGEVLGRRCRLAQFTCAAVVGLEPMETFISASVNPDALMVPLWTLALWLGARVIRRGAPRRDTVALAALTAAAVLTKPASYALVVASVVALGLGWLRSAPGLRSWGGLVRTLGPTLLVLIVPIVGWLMLATALNRPVVNQIGGSAGAPPVPFNVAQFLSYVWQFYLPRLPGMKPSVRTGFGLYDVWLRQGWGSFAFLDVPLAGWVYTALAALTAAIAGAAALVVARLRGSERLALLAFFATAMLALVFGLHLTEYRAIIAGEGPILQGRYLLPGLSLFGLAAALIVTRLPPRPRVALVATGMAGLVILQLLSLGTVTKVFYT